MPLIARRVAQIVLAVLAATMSSISLGDAGAAEPAVEYRPARPLYQGWNLIAWVGEDSTVGSVRNEISTLIEVHQFVAQTGESNRVDDSAVLQDGDLLWFRMSATSGEPAMWRTESNLTPRRIDLDPGINYIPWVGRDSVRLSDLFAGIVTQVPHVTLWSADEQRWRLVRTTSTDEIVRTGDVVALYTPEAFPWTQPNGIRGDLKFGSSLTTTQREALIAETAAAETMLAADFEFHPDEYTISVATTWAELAQVARRPDVADLSPGGCPGEETLALVNRSCSGIETLAIRITITVLRGAAYETWGLGNWLYTHRPNDPDSMAKHARLIQESRVVPTAFNEPSDGDLRPLWYLWTDWLIQQFGGPALISYIRTGDYRRAFGRTGEQLYAAFAEYRRVVAPRIAGSNDRILISGTEALANEQWIRQTIADVEQFFLQEFGFSPEDIAWQVTSISGSGLNDCGIGSYAAVFIGPDCLRTPSTYAHEYFHQMQATWGAIGNGAQVGCGDWHQEGQATYWEALFAAANGDRAYEVERRSWLLSASSTSTSRLDDPDLAISPDFSEYWLGALATELLASIAGRHAVRDWYRGIVTVYRQTGDLDGAEPRAFEETYGISTDEFFRRFAKWWDDGFPQLPNTAIQQ